MRNSPPFPARRVLPLPSHQKSVIQAVLSCVIIFVIVCIRCRATASTEAAAIAARRRRARARIAAQIAEPTAIRNKTNCRSRHVRRTRHRESDVLATTATIGNARIYVRTIRSRIVVAATAAGTSLTTVRAAIIARAILTKSTHKDIPPMYRDFSLCYIVCTRAYKSEKRRQFRLLFYPSYFVAKV